MSLKLNKVHHVAIIASDYEKSKSFYINVLGCQVLAEVNNGKSPYPKLHLSLNGEYVLELFSFDNSPPRASYPEAHGLRHIGFEVDDLDEAVQWLNDNDLKTEEVKLDPMSKKRYTFFYDPDMLPIELFEAEPRN